MEGLSHPQWDSGTPIIFCYCVVRLSHRQAMASFELRANRATTSCDAVWLRALFRSPAWRHDRIPKALYLNSDVIIAGDRHMLPNLIRLMIERLYQSAKLIA